MRAKRPILALILSFLAGPVVPGEGSQAPPPPSVERRLHPCRVPGVDEEVRCGSYEVFENRAARRGRTIALNIVVLPARSPDRLPDPLVFLAGGGVAPATSYASFLGGAYANLRRNRDILLVDQRGTGGSNPLRCDLSTDPASADYRNDDRFVSNVRRCRQELERKADLHHYTTPIAMDDLDDVRRWLGYPRLNLFGVSYGTTAAMVYLRRHGEHVRTVVLQGVLPLDVPTWLEVPRSSQQALERVFAACARQPGCQNACPELENEFDSLLKRLAAEPVHVRASEPGTGQHVDVTIDDEILRVFVVRMLYSASRLHDLPLLIHLAYRGEYQPLAERLAIPGDSSIPKGVYLSIVCSELIPQFDPGDLPAAAEGTFLGSFRIGREVTACREWVRGRLPSDFWAPVESQKPVLILNGSLDHITPPRYGERVARSFPNSRHLVLPERGHNDTDPCVNGIIEAFVTAGRLETLDTRCLAKSGDLTFALKSDDLGK
ncbi:MAG TPA: alpha/beta hydrolase [Thermoanaerobaculia bacterium]|nr:alpha/beta hydrolase [Thermoanaerobaculia bacterium]